MPETLPLNDLRIAASIILSAALYFFDFGTNIHTAIIYYRVEYEWHSYPAKINGGFQAGTFQIVMCIMIGAHVGSALVFAFNVETRREAMKAAFLLPLVHLRRLALLLWRKGSLRGVSGIASEELSSVYNVLAAAMEAAPQIFIQLNILQSFVNGSYRDYRNLPRELVISVVASIISVIYNCSQATALAMGKASFKARALAGLISGVYSTSALVVGCIGIATLQKMISYIGTWPAGIMMCSLYVGSILGIPALTFWRALAGDSRAASPAKRLLLSIAFAYMSVLIGPLFALLNIRINNHHRRHPSNGSSESFQGKLVALSMAYILPAVLLFIFCLFKIFQGAQTAIQNATDGLDFFNATDGLIFFRANYPCGDYIGENVFCSVGTIVGFECAVAIHVVSIFLVISFDKCSKNKGVEKEENDLSELRGESINEYEICALGTGEARIGIGKREEGNAFMYNRLQGCML